MGFKIRNETTTLKLTVSVTLAARVRELRAAVEKAGGEFDIEDELSAAIASVREQLEKHLADRGTSAAKSAAEVQSE